MSIQDERSLTFMTRSREVSQDLSRNLTIMNNFNQSIEQS